MREMTLNMLASTYAGHHNVSLSRIGFLAVNDGKFFTRIQAGKSCTVRTYNRTLQWLSDHWPADLPWPDDIPRPERSETKGDAVPVGAR